jgi:prolyl-tRNA synthetase
MCGDALEERSNATILGTDVKSAYIPRTNGECIICGKKGKVTLVGRAY